MTVPERLRWHDVTKAQWKKLSGIVGFSAEDDLPWLGSGCFASTYDLGGGRVLKHTTDHSDMKLAKLLEENPLWGFVQVFNTHTLDEHAFVVVEKLTKVPKKWYNFVAKTNHLRDPVQNYFYWETSEKKEQYTEQLEWLDKLAQVCWLNNLSFTDIHANNIMMNADKEVVISDLGCSKIG